jgi:hypothetical protein
VPSSSKRAAVALSCVGCLKQLRQVAALAKDSVEGRRAAISAAVVASFVAPADGLRPFPLLTW